MARGGKRRNAGRPAGSKTRLPAIRKLAVETAHKVGLLPHEILLLIARGEEIKVPRQIKEAPSQTIVLEEGQKAPAVEYDRFRPTLAQMMQAAAAAAPYYAPRLVTHEVGGIGGGAIQMNGTMTVQMYTPDNTRRVAPPAASNDAVALPARKQA